MSEYQGLPVAGYRPQSQTEINIVNSFKREEEKLLRMIDRMEGNDSFDQRWLSIARTHLEQAFMAVNRSVFRPTRVELPEDEA